MKNVTFQRQGGVLLVAVREGAAQLNARLGPQAVRGSPSICSPSAGVCTVACGTVAPAQFMCDIKIPIEQRGCGCLISRE
jgi:hypothetical protein